MGLLYSTAVPIPAIKASGGVVQPCPTMVVSKLGRSELGNDLQEPNASDPVVTLKPMDEWTTASTKPELDNAVRKRIEQIPGANYLLSQPIQQRVDELVSGVRAEATVKVLGENLGVLRKTAEDIQAIMQQVQGVKDISVEQLFGQVYLTVDIDRRKIARHGINVAHIREIISTAIGAEAATQVYEGQKRFDLILRYPEQYRNSVETIQNILLTTTSGALIPLGDLARVELIEGPALISREGLHRRIYIGFNTFGTTSRVSSPRRRKRSASRSRYRTGTGLLGEDRLRVWSELWPG